MKAPNVLLFEFGIVTIVMIMTMTMIMRIVIMSIRNTISIIIVIIVNTIFGSLRLPSTLRAKCSPL